MSKPAELVQFVRENEIALKHLLYVHFEQLRIGNSLEQGNQMTEEVINQYLRVDQVIRSPLAFEVVALLGELSE